MSKNIVSYIAIIVATSTMTVAANHKIDELTNDQRVSFAQLPCEANTADQTIFKQSVSQLHQDGWAVDILEGTTGSASAQATSNMGIMAYKGNKVVIATRGTAKTNLNDWTSNVRSNRNGVVRGVFHTLAGMFTDHYKNKEDFIAAQYLNLNGAVHNGFLQTHNSMWDKVKQNIQNHAKKQGVAVSDLEFETVGHSMGAAQQDLNQVHLLTDSTLGLGTKVVEDEFQDNDLGMSFIGLKKTERIENRNVRGTAFEAPNAFTTDAGKDFNERVGKGNSPHIHNAYDLVPYLPANAVGYAAVGDQIAIDSSHRNPVAAHLIKNIRPTAVEALDQHDQGQSKVAAPAKSSSMWSALKGAIKTGVKSSRWMFGS